MINLHAINLYTSHHISPFEATDPKYLWWHGLNLHDQNYIAGAWSQGRDYSRDRKIAKLNHENYGSNL